MSARPDHGLLLGLIDDDHPQYFNQARLDSWYALEPTKPYVHTHVEADITDLGNYSEVGHSHTESDISDLGSYSTVGHSHTESDISDLGNYSVVGHTHSYVPLAGGTMTGSLYQTHQYGLRLNKVGQQHIYKEGDGGLYIQNRNANDAIYLQTYDTAFRTRIALTSTVTELYDNGGDLAIQIGANANLYEGDYHTFRNRAGVTQWRMVYDTTGDDYYKLETGESASTYIAWDTTNNRWLMTIGGTIVLRLSAAATRFPQVYTDTVASGVANVMVSSDGRIRRIVTPSAP